MPMPARFDASGLPADDGPFNRHPHRTARVVNRQGPPCIEERCTNTTEVGQAYCADCRPINQAEARAVIRPFPIESLPPGTPTPHFVFEPTVQVSFDDGETWSEVRGLGAFSIEMSPDPFGDDSFASCRYPTDRITGAPHHCIINGDHDGCGCGGHLIECETHADPHWRHAPSICGITRTLCNHTPRHLYREPCEDYAADPLQAVGRPQGCIAHGGPDCVCEVDDGPADG